jgi:hypothetical protein
MSAHQLSEVGNNTGGGYTGQPPSFFTSPSSTSPVYQGGSSPSSSSNSFGVRPRRGFDGRDRGQGQRYGEGSSFSSFPTSRGGERRPHPTAYRGGGGRGAAALMEEGPRTKLSSYVTPYDAVQAQPAQHGASIVRSGSAATEGGSILFFSSVQKKGGAFTSTERETYAQLRQSRAIPAGNRGGRGGNGGNVVGSGIMTRNVARQFDELEKARAAQELGAVRSAVTATKRTRFTLASDDDGDDDDDDDEEDAEEAEEGGVGEVCHEDVKAERPSDEGPGSDGEAETNAKRVRVETPPAQDSPASRESSR